MWGIIPAAGQGSRIQPLAFSKELLPMGSRLDGSTERPRAISEYLVERMLHAGATKLCFVISPRKSDILDYYGANSPRSASVAFVVQPQPSGLCDALFRASPLIAPEESVVVGLPDTLWFPVNGLCALPENALSFLLFPVEQPELFDSVITGDGDRVKEIQVKKRDPDSRWVWGAFKMPGALFHELHSLWRSRECQDEYFGTLVNAWLAKGGEAFGIREGSVYIDVGTLRGYRDAVELLSAMQPKEMIPV